MSNVGPVCHIPPKTTQANPQPQNMPGIPGPAAASDINSIVNLLNAMRQALLAMLNQLNANNTAINNLQQGFQRVPQPGQPQWSEQSRSTSTVRVYQNNDKNSSNWVDVDQINQLTMVDKSTGAKWVWSRGDS